MSAGQRLASTPAPTHYWQGQGVRLAGDAWGDPNGPLVLLQHGGGQTRHAWKGAGETLGAAGYYAIAFDARLPCVGQEVGELRRMGHLGVVAGVEPGDGREPV